MKKFFKKLVALTLAGCLALGGVPSVAFSDEQEVTIESPAAEVIAEPTAEQTVEPAAEPTVEPTAYPTAEPTEEPIAEPTAEPMLEPTSEPTEEPTPEPEQTPEPPQEVGLLSVTVPAEWGDIDNNYNPDPTNPLGDLVDIVNGKTKYSISFNTMIGGSVTASKSTDIAEGESITLTIAYSDGWKLDALVVDGENVTETAQVKNNSTYTFNMPAHNVTVSATFVSTQISFTAKMGDNTVTQTVDAGTTFYDWYLSYAGQYATLGSSYWERTRTGAADKRSSLSSMKDEIQAGDTYVQFAVAAMTGSGFALAVYADCDVNEVGTSYSGYMISSGKLTVHHTVDGEAKDFVLTSSKNKLSDFLDGESWYDAATGEKVDVSTQVPLKKTAYECKYEVSIISVVGNGTVTAEPNPAKPGETVTLTSTPDEGYMLKVLNLNTRYNTDVASKVVDGKYTFTMPERGVFVSATFEAIPYEITVDEAVMECINVQYFATHGASVTVAPIDGYVLDSVTVTDENGNAITTTKGDDGTYTFIMPMCKVNLTATATVKKLHDIIVRPSALNDYIAVSAEKAAAGDTITVTAYPDTGYEVSEIKYTYTNDAFEDVTTMLTPVNGVYTFTMPDAYVIIEVTFEKTTTYTITVADCTGGTVKADKTTAVQGDTVTLTVTPDTNYVLDTLTVSNGQANIETTQNADDTYSFTMPADDVTVTATFKRVYTVKIDSECTEYLSLPNGKTQFAAGETVTVDVIEKSGKVIYGVSVNKNLATEEVPYDHSDDYSSISFTMPAYDVMVTAGVYDGYYVTINIVGGDDTCNVYFWNSDITNFGEKLWVGSDVTLIPVIGDNYIFKSVTVKDQNGEVSPSDDSNITLGIYSYTISSDVTITAEFERAYKVSIDENSKDYLSLISIDGKYAENDSATIRMKMRDAGKVYKSVSVKEADSDTPVAFSCNKENNAITFTMPDADVVVSCEVVDGYYYTINTIGGDENCHIGVEDATSTAFDGKYYVPGSKLVCGISSGDDYRVKNVTVTDKKGAPLDCCCQDDMIGRYEYEISSDVSITVEYEKLYTVTIDEYSTDYASMPNGLTKYGVNDTVTIKLTDVEGTVITGINIQHGEGDDFDYLDYTYDAEKSTVTFTMPADDVGIYVRRTPGYYITVKTVGGDENCGFSLDLQKSELTGKLYAKAETQITAEITCEGYVPMWKIEYSGGPEMQWSETIDFKMPASNTVLTVSYYKKYDVTLNETVNGTAKVTINDQPITGSGVTYETANVFIGEITPIYGYELDTITVLDSENQPITVQQSSEGYFFIMPSSNVTISVTFKLKPDYYSITVVGEGLVYGGKTAEKAGETVIITPAEGYKLGTATATAESGVSISRAFPYVDGKGCMSFTMPASNVTVEIKNAEKAYKIIIADTVGGTVTATNVNGYEVVQEAAGWKVRIAVHPEEGYRCGRVTVTDASGNRENVFPLDETDMYYFYMSASDVTVTVTFPKIDSITHSINISETTHGKLTAYPATAIEGDEVVIDISPETGYEITKLIVDGTDVTAQVAKGKYTFNMPDHDVAVSAEFALQVSDYTITLIANPEGSAVVKLKNGIVSVSPADGYQLDAVTVTAENGETIHVGDKGYNKTFRMPECNVTITVEARRVYKANVAETTNGTVTAVYAECVAGQYNAVRVQPEDGYCVGTVTVVKANDETVPVTEEIMRGETLYCFYMPAEDVTITVTFTKTDVASSYVITIPSSVSLNDASSMTVTASDVQNLNGQSINVAVTSENGGKLKCGENEIGYSFAQSLNFIENGSQNLALTIGEGETTGKPAGTYTDTLNFSVSITSTAAGQ